MNKLIVKTLQKIGISGCRIDVMCSDEKFFVRMGANYLCDDSGELLMFDTGDDASEVAKIYFRCHLNENARRLGFNNWKVVESEDLKVKIVLN